MLRRTFLGGSAASGLVLTLPAKAQAAPVPAEAFGRLPATSDPKLMPDGKHLALMQSVNGRPVAAIFETATMGSSKPVMVSAGSDMIIDDIRWVKNDRLVLFVKHSYTPAFDKLRTWMRTITVDLTGGNFAMLMRNMPGYEANTWVADIFDVNPDNPDQILMGIYNPIFHHRDTVNSLIRKKDDVFRYDAISVDVRTGKGTLLKSGDSDTTVEFEQSKIMFEALQNLNKRVELIAFDGEDHYFNLADTRIRFLKETELFLAAALSG